ncbi:hypothetical protein [Saccharibacillus sp. JS10]|uniref:hypothetical protein n=1 Tax=Saccharibacillus sp. JS10 TaxID=2950552 RepID=UPI00210B2362|nr:hypothetical protein [Saccharibacillus sp. JS10]MCQ4088256.1 hypothetical protein [Saccharibacillus sp. JS10]
MKTYTRTASLLGVLLLSGALAACGNESNTAATNEPADSAAVSNDAGVKEPATASSDDKASTDEKANADDKGTDSDTATTDDKSDDKATDSDKATSGGSQSTDADSSDQDASESAANPAAAQDKDPANVEKQGEKGAGTDRPKTEKIQLSSDTFGGKLEEGYGYSLYVTEGLKFDAERNRLSMASNPDYYAIITPLEKGYSLASLRTSGKKDLEVFGSPAELKGTKIPEALQRSRMFMSAEGDMGMGQYALWETPYKAYELKIRIPEGADADKFAPLAYASLSTIAD